MLALSYGAKGIFFEPFYSSGNVKGLMKLEAPYAPRDIGIQVRDNISPRLNGTLGNTLLGLQYSDNFINIEYQEQLPESFDNQADFLTIQHSGMSYHWHAGFFNQKE
jgi:hypothetical protein